MVEGWGDRGFGGGVGGEGGGHVANDSLVSRLAAMAISVLKSAWKTVCGIYLHTKLRVIFHYIVRYSLYGCNSLEGKKKNHVYALKFNKRLNQFT